MTPEIDVFKVVDFIRDNASKLAEAKANRVYLEEFRKSQKAISMKQAEKNGFNSGILQEREAYQSTEYLTVLDGLKAAVEEEERLRWLMTAAQAKIACWQTKEASRRAEMKIL